MPNTVELLRISNQFYKSKLAHILKARTNYATEEIKLFLDHLCQEKTVVIELNGDIDSCNEFVSELCDLGVAIGCCSWHEEYPDGGLKAY